MRSATQQVMSRFVSESVSSRSTRTRRARANFALSAAALAGLSGVASGQIKSWTGGSSQDSNWTSQANWFGSIAPIPGNDALVFDGITRHSPEGRWFQQLAATEGFHAAVEWRDSGQWIPEGGTVALDD